VGEDAIEDLCIFDDGDNHAVGVVPPQREQRSGVYRMDLPVRRARFD
jgi:hypothetical protein